MADKALQPVEQKQVDFYGDTLTAVRLEDGHIYVVLRHMCTALSIDMQGQTQRINRHTILSSGKGVCILHTPGGKQSTTVLRVDLVPLWLTGISTRSIKDATIREKLERFQLEAAAVLWEAFQDGRLTTESVLDVEALAAAGDEAAQALIMAQAVVRMARQQLRYQHKTDAWLRDHDQMHLTHSTRIESLETAVTELTAPGRHITEAQATQISQAVKAVAMALSKKSKRNEYGGVYGELYRRYEINSYKLLPIKQFEDTVNWLNDWLQMLTGGIV